MVQARVGLRECDIFNRRWLVGIPVSLPITIKSPAVYILVVITYVVYIEIIILVSTSPLELYPDGRRLHIDRYRVLLIVGIALNIDGVIAWEQLNRHVEIAAAVNRAGQHSVCWIGVISQGDGDAG